MCMHSSKNVCKTVKLWMIQNCFSSPCVKCPHSYTAIAACRNTCLHRQTNKHIVIHSTEQAGLGLQYNEIVQYRGFHAVHHLSL